jgi:hypothetical protein
MPSPFPGMDPFLEDPAVFPDLHDSLITYCRESLQRRLPKPYYCVIGSRIWMEPQQRLIGPDVRVQRTGRKRSREVNGGTAVRTRSEPVIISIIPEEVRETLVEIRVPDEKGDRLVTVIEVLSPTNKTAGPGRESYLRKQQEVLANAVHLIEVDLLRGGAHTTAVDRDIAVHTAGPFDYHVCLRDFERPNDYSVYPVRLEDKLPEIIVPLLPGETPLTLDLQVLFERSYDTGPYERWVHYEGKMPGPALSSEQMKWAKQILAGRKPARR